MNEKDDNNDEIIEMGNIKDKNTIITQENKPYNFASTSNEIQNIFKKIRKKNKESEIKKYPNDFVNEESKDILANNDQEKKSSKENIDIKETTEIIVLIISFICFYFSFIPVTEYFSPITFFIFPMDLFSFILCFISSVITAGFISLVILQKMTGFYILYIILYYMIIFFLNHFKYIGSSHFDQSISVFYTFISILIHSLCLWFILYFSLKHFYYEGNIKKDNIFVRSFVPRWHSSEKIKKSENLLNDQNNLRFLNKKRNNIQLYLIIFGLLSLEIGNIILIAIKKREIFTCDNWEIGINGTKINEINNKCQIPKPKGYCYMNYFKGYFELSKNEDKICSLRDPTLEKKYFIQNLEDRNKNINIYGTNIFAFPLTNYDQKYSLKNAKNFGLLVNKDIYDYSKNQNKEQKPEAILDFSKDNKFNGKFGELKINLNFNKTLSEERKLLENDNSLFDNVFLINLQSTSRAHFQRSFPKLSNFIKNFMKYSSPLNEKKLEAYQFLKYHSFSESTSYNIIPMFYGSSLKSNKGTNHIRYFKENGFITGHEIDMCRKELCAININKKDEKQFEEWDHENIAYLCNGNYFEIKNEFPDDRGASSFKERCLYGNPVSYYMINYAKQFWEKYSDNKKYFRMGFNYGFEKTGEVISYLDEVLYNFIFEYYDKGYFDNTALFIVSDNGNQKEGIYNIISNYEFELEKKFGTFILLLNGHKGIKNYEKNLLKNQHIFMTPYDIHDTLIHIVYGDSNIDEIKSKFSVNYKGNSVLLEINENERTCKKYDDWIDNSFCCCLSDSKEN